MFEYLLSKFGYVKKDKFQVHLEVRLKCPDGFEESVSFELPREVKEFSSCLEQFSAKDSFVIRCFVYEHLVALGQLKNLSNREVILDVK
jgi:hypothetical protein